MFNSDAEAAIAERMQRAMLPNEVTVPGYDLSLDLVAAPEVGGDLVDFLPHGNGNFWLAVGDVTGHGVMPTLVTTMAQTLFTGFALDRPNAQPSELLALINRTLHHSIRHRMRGDHFMTLQLIHHEGDGRFKVAGLHCDLLIFRAQTRSIVRMQVPGFWIGLLPYIESYTVDVGFELGSGDILLIYTDGLIAAMNEAGEQFDMTRLGEALARYADLPGDEINRRIVKDVKTWLTRQLDDISLIVLKRQ